MLDVMRKAIAKVEPRPELTATNERQAAPKIELIP